MKYIYITFLIFVMLVIGYFFLTFTAKEVAEGNKEPVATESATIGATGATGFELGATGATGY